MERICDHCKNKLKKFTKTVDWKGRKYHINCHKKVIKLYDMNCFIEIMNKKCNTNVSKLTKI